MPLAIVFVILFLLKILDIPPVGNWKWYWVLLPFALLMLWWNVITPMIGWDKRQAEKKMAKEALEAEETKRKNRGF
ncbi:MAG: TIGR04438 family Trp-rich protein [Usitatibacteraceae bacterium]